MDYSKMRVLVVGMARSGIAAAKLLYKLGTKEIILNDMREREAFGGKLDELFALGMTDRLGMEPDALIHGADLIVFSSGVPFWREWIKDARAMGIPCINELELAYWVTKADFVAITGTNGKTTTTTLVSEIFRAAGKVSHPVGNIGDPACTYAYEMKRGDIAVAEVAPFQLVSTLQFHPRVSAILNITEDHLDWFQTMENYINGKCIVFQNQTEADWCVLNYDNAITRSLGGQPKARVLFFSTSARLEEGAYVEDDRVFLSVDGNTRALMHAREIRIPGNHNLENALAAALIATLMCVPDDVIVQTLRTFAGVEHRIETVASIGGVTYINDSKGTNPDATVMAIRAMERPTILILGGYDKHGDFHPMFREFNKWIAHIVVLGQTQRQIVETAREEGFHNVTMVDSLEQAVSVCHELAKPGMNVLLSPACASWDMFSDYEQRGRRFKELVMELK